MDIRAKFKIAAGRRLAHRGSSNPPPIGTWERVGWDETHNQITWDRHQREQRQSQAHITTGQFTPLRRHTTSTWLGQMWLSLRSRNQRGQSPKDGSPILK